MSDRRENATVNEGTGDHEFTVVNLEKYLAANENVVNVKTLERCFNERIEKEMNIIVDTVEDTIQNAILTASDCFVAQKIEFAFRLINASFG